MQDVFWMLDQHVAPCLLYLLNVADLRSIRPPCAALYAGTHCRSLQYWHCQCDYHGTVKVCDTFSSLFAIFQQNKLTLAVLSFSEI